MVAAAAGFLVTLSSLALLWRFLPRRANFRQKSIPTSAGLAFIPIILGAYMAGMLAGWERDALAFLLYTLVAGLVGYVDDMWGGAEARGFRGHFGALVRGRVTTGVIKAGVLGGGAFIFALAAVDGGIFGVIIASVLMAGSVNLANLFDVRPARTLKFLGIPSVLLLLAVPEHVRVAVLPVLGGALALFGLDLRGRLMLGDSGAAVCGAVAGYLVVMSGPGVVWWVALAVILGLTAVAEAFSISALIERSGMLRRLDRWGRID